MQKYTKFYFLHQLPNFDKPKPNRMLSGNLMCFRFGFSKLAKLFMQAKVLLHTIEDKAIFYIYEPQNHQLPYLIEPALNFFGGRLKK